MSKIIWVVILSAIVLSAENLFASDPVFESIYRKAQEEARKLEENGALLDEVSANDYSGKKLFILISSSIPDQIVQNFMRSTSSVNDQTVFVLRGFIGGMETIQATLEYVRGILCDDKEFGDPQCIQALVDINPGIFETFSVEKVPAVIYLPSGAKYPGCGSEEMGTLNNAAISYGDAPVEIHLAKMAKVVPSAKEEIKVFMESIKEQFYQGK